MAQGAIPVSGWIYKTRASKAGAAKATGLDAEFWDGPGMAKQSFFTSPPSTKTGRPDGSPIWVFTLTCWHY